MVKKFVSENSECKLLSKEYINNRLNLEFKCKCGNSFSANFSNFKTKNKRQCNECSSLIQINKRKVLYIEVKKIVENLGYELISKEYINNKQKLALKDKMGFYYVISLVHLIRGETPNKYYKLNPYTIQNIKLFLKLNKLNFDLIDNTYLNNHQYLTFKDKLGYLYYSNINQLQIYKSLRAFSFSNPYTIQNIKLWCKLNNKTYILISSIYKNARDKLKWKCLKENCEEEFYMNWNNIYSGFNCPYCSGDKAGLSNCLATKNPQLASEWHTIKNGDLTPYNIVCNSHKKVWWQCKECGHEWYTSIAARNGKSKTGCPECNKSKGEKKIGDYLISKGFKKLSLIEYNKLKYKNNDNNNYYFIPQQEFDSLIGVGGRNLSYDFYLPILNLLIEFQGEQHKRFIKGIHITKNKFEVQKEHDKRKREYANDNNIKLLEIWYWDFDNIENILEDYLIN